MRIFLDANILFSAGKTAGAVRRLLHDARAAGHILVVDGYVVAEARRNIEMKFPGVRTDLEALLGGLETSGHVTKMNWPDVRPALPEKDLPVLAAAVHLRCDVLLTGDRTHFGRFFGAVLCGVRVLSPAMLAADVFREESHDA